jgi:hypothetical protein
MPRRRVRGVAGVSSGGVAGQGLSGGRSSIVHLADFSTGDARGVTKRRRTVTSCDDHRDVAV